MQATRICPTLCAAPPAADIPTLPNFPVRINTDIINILETAPAIPYCMLNRFPNKKPSTTTLAAEITIASRQLYK